VALGLPATPGEIGRDLWLTAAERAEICTDVRALGDLVA
jgi:hypothetical protein